jgi:hypothetical protein
MVDIALQQPPGGDVEIPRRMPSPWRANMAIAEDMKLGIPLNEWSFITNRKEEDMDGYMEI